MNMKKDEMISKIVTMGEIIKLGKAIREVTKPCTLFSTKGDWSLDKVANKMKVLRLQPNFYVKKNTDIRVYEDTILPLKSEKGEEVNLTVKEIFTQASEILNKRDEEAKMKELEKTLTVKYNNEREREVLVRLSEQVREQKEKLAEARMINMSAKAEEKRIELEMLADIYKDEKLTSNCFDDKLAQLSLVSEDLVINMWKEIAEQDSESVKAYTQMMNDIKGKSKDEQKSIRAEYQEYQEALLTYEQFVESYVNMLSRIVANSFEKNELMSNENFEKRSEYDALIDATLIKSNLFDYKVKDSELNNDKEIAQFLIEEAINHSINRDINYHMNNIKKDDCFEPKVSSTGKQYQLLYHVTEAQIKKIEKLMMIYYRVHKNLPSMPVKSISEITSSTLANAIIKKYRKYLDMDAPASDKQVQKLFDIFVKWSLGKEESRLAWCKNARLNYSYKELFDISNLVRDNMYLVKAYSLEHNMKVLDTCKELLSFNDETRVLLKRSYARKEQREYETQWFSLENDK